MKYFLRIRVRIFAVRCICTIAEGEEPFCFFIVSGAGIRFRWYTLRSNLSISQHSLTRIVVMNHVRKRALHTMYYLHKIPERKNIKRADYYSIFSSRLNFFFASKYIHHYKIVYVSRASDSLSFTPSVIITYISTSDRPYHRMPFLTSAPTHPNTYSIFYRKVQQPIYQRYRPEGSEIQFDGRRWSLE